MAEFAEGTVQSVLEHYGWDLPSPRHGWYTVKCGAHKDSRASCRINQEKNAVICQACGFSGDLIKIVRHYEGEKSYREVVAIIEEVSGNLNTEVLRGSSGVRGRNLVSSGKRDKRGNSTFISPRLRGRPSSGGR